jgi:N-acetylneuraminic acid mutarotase
MEALGRRRLAVAVAVLAVLLGASATSAAPQAKWQRLKPMPVPRTEVAATAYDGAIAVIGGFTATKGALGRFDLYQPAKRKWKRMPALPEVVNHASAVTARGKLYVVGGYGKGIDLPKRTAFSFDGKRWTRLTLMPDGRAAAAAAVVGGKLYVVGGVSLGKAALADDMLVLDLATGDWSTAPGPTQREHLAAVAAGGLVYAIGGRLGDLSTNLDTVEAYDPATGSWSPRASVPYKRGGTGAAFANGLVVSVGGEEEGGTIGSVYGYTPATNRWRRLPSLPTPRHGLGVVAIKKRVYAVGGGPSPGLFVSGANELLTLP